MSTTWKMPPGASASDVVFWILKAHDQSPELALKNVVINCHGAPGILAVGGVKSPWLEGRDIGLFNQLATRDIGTIWLTACQVAQGGAGEDFCSRLARASHCDVVASDENQVLESRYIKAGAPHGTLDDFEGTAYRFSPGGGKVIYSFKTPPWKIPYGSTA